MELPPTNAVLYAHYWQLISGEPSVPAEKKGADADAATTISNNQPAVSTPQVPREEALVADRVSQMGDRFRSELRDAIGDEVQVARSKQEFLERLKAGGSNLLLLWSFTHGHSGDTIDTFNGKTLVMSEVGGQRLSFSETNFLAAQQLKTETIVQSGNYYFSSRPFVFLNGCETGTQGARATTDHSLPGIFLIRGARGVVATEAPIWDLFGYAFGATFLEKLMTGVDAGVAMLETRREFMQENRNPFGLLYSFYGNPAVRIAKPGM